MRFHLFEFEDYQWFPHVIREGITDYLRFVTEKFGVYKPAAKIIADAVNRTGLNKVYDLCAGGGGGVKTVSRELLSITGKNIEIILTDKYPNLDAFKNITKGEEGKISFLDESIDAANVPDKLKGIRTMYSSFHHFDSDDAVKILSDAAKNNLPILIFEAGERSLIGILGVIFTTIIICAVATPFMKPFKWSRLFFTYVLPLVPLVLLWDGIVSMLRIYKPEEMLELSERVEVKNYKWEAGKIKHGPGKIIYMTGLPGTK
jgi:hypothetical protein